MVLWIVAQERFESLARIQDLDLDPRPFVHQRLVAGEVEVHQLAAPCRGRSGQNGSTSGT